MRINIFFSSLFTTLLGIWILFEPIALSEQKKDEIPIFEIASFILYEVDSEGLRTLMSGKNGQKFIDRYSVEMIEYVDSVEKKIATIRAKSGLYRDDIIYLSGDVTYMKEDGLSFYSEALSYDKKNYIATSMGAYRLEHNKSFVEGSMLVYNNQEKSIISKNIFAIYDLDERGAY